MSAYQLKIPFIIVRLQCLGAVWRLQCLGAVWRLQFLGAVWRLQCLGAVWRLQCLGAVWILNIGTIAALMTGIPLSPAGCMPQSHMLYYFYDVYLIIL